VNVLTLPLDAITPYWRNPRSNEVAIDAVATSIREFGYNQPIVVDADHVIVLGDTRYRALRRLGWTEAEVLQVDLAPERARALRIIDNRTHEFAEWDWEKLRLELADAGDLASPFFSADELDELTAEAAATPVADNGESQPRTISAGATTVPVTCPGCGTTVEIAI
jgi:site-specific DNA-methyltransferase (adenine-specific)